MAWFELHQELCAHPKTKRMAKMLGISVPQAVGHCVCLWAWAMDYAQDGVLTDHGQDGIADAAQWTGDPNVLIQAMTDCGVGGKPGFLEFVNDELVIHDWEDYAGKYIEKRERERLRQRERRSGGKSPQGSNNVHSTLPQHTADVAANIRQDKIRGENITQDIISNVTVGAPTNGAADDVLIDPITATVVHKWEEVFFDTPWALDPPMAQIGKWLHFSGPDVLCYMIEQAKGKRNPAAWLWTTYDNWRQQGEVSPAVEKAVHAQHAPKRAPVTAIIDPITGKRVELAVAT